MASNEPYPKWLADVTGAVMTLVTLALIGYFLGVKAQLWQPPSAGFWIF